MAGKTLVAVFSASGVTKKVGEEIARMRLQLKGGLTEYFKRKGVRQ